MSSRDKENQEIAEFYRAGIVSGAAGEGMAYTPPNLHEARLHTAATTLTLLQVRSVVDVGCGKGLVSLRLPDSCVYTGIDLVPELIALANADARTNSLFAVGDETAPFRASAVLCCGVMSHIGPDRRDDFVKSVALMGDDYVVFEAHDPSKYFGTFHSHSPEWLRRALLKSGCSHVYVTQNDGDSAYLMVGVKA